MTISLYGIGGLLVILLAWVGCQIAAWFLGADRPTTREILAIVEGDLAIRSEGQLRLFAQVFRTTLVPGREVSSQEWLDVLRRTPTADLVAHAKLLLSFAERSVFGHWFVAAARVVELIDAGRVAPAGGGDAIEADIDQLITALDRLVAQAVAAPTARMDEHPTMARPSQLAA